MLDIPGPASAPDMYCSAAGMGLVDQGVGTQHHRLHWPAGERAGDAFLDDIQELAEERCLGGPLQRWGE